MLRRYMRYVIAGIMAMAMVLAFASCAAKTETGTETGTLKDAAEDSLVVSAESGDITFKTTDGTIYKLNGTERLTIGDTVEVDYQKKAGKYFAEVVTVKEHRKIEQKFSGNVVKLTKEGLTVAGASMTVTFVRNSYTDIEGDLTEGNDVEIIYTGDLSEYPYASVIKVTKEADLPEVAEISGVVSEFTEKSVLIAIDSATSYRFAIDKNTKVSGEDKYVRIGDNITITYKGKLGETPKAQSIVIFKKAEEHRRTVNGTIRDVEKHYVTLDTGKKVYIINTDEYTRYTGDKPAKGYKSEITYTGNLASSKAVAINIYCVKQTPDPVKYKVKFVDGAGNTLKTEKVVKGKAATAPADPKRKGFTFKGWDKDFTKVTKNMTVTALWEENKEPDPPSPEEPVTVKGTITQWTSEDSNTFRVAPKDGDGELVLNINDDVEIMSGYFPAVNDVVKVTYLESTMMTTKLELVERPEEKVKPEEDPEEEPEEDVEPAEEEPEEEAAPEEEEPEEEAAPEEEEPEEEAAPEAEEPEAEPEPEEEPEEKEPESAPEVIVETTGFIIEGDEENRTFKLRTDDDKEIELKIDQTTEISSGYFPAKDDEVKIIYEKNSMVLKDIQILNKAVPAEAAQEETAE